MGEGDFKDRKKQLGKSLYGLEREIVCALSSKNKLPAVAFCV